MVMLKNVSEAKYISLLGIPMVIIIIFLWPDIELYSAVLISIITYFPEIWTIPVEKISRI